MKKRNKKEADKSEEDHKDRELGKKMSWKRVIEETTEKKEKEV
jgi:hypothetical protein